MIPKQNKNKIFLTIIGILLIANIAMVSLFLLKKDGDKYDKQRPDRKTMIANFLKNEIRFSKEQLQQYDTLSTEHREHMKKIFDSLRSSKEKQFKELTAANFSDSAMNNMADRSATSQRIMELQMFNHLKNVRLICTPAQLPKFDSLFVKILNRRGSEGRKKDPDNK